MKETTQAALKRIEEGIEAVRNGERYREYLAFCARFHKYSLANQILIWSQRPNARMVAGFRAWTKLGRHVRKGEKGIMILAPMPTTRTKDQNGNVDEDAEQVVYFRPVYVFDVSQTEGEPLPSPTELLTGDDAGLWPRLAALASRENLVLDREQLSGIGANGFYIRKGHRIWVSPELEPLQAAKTLAHELGHHFARHDEKAHGREDAEMIAESVAFVVMAYLGQDSGRFSFGYLASWGDAKLFRHHLEEVNATASKLIQALETPVRMPLEQ